MGELGSGGADGQARRGAPATSRRRLLAGLAGGVLAAPAVLRSARGDAPKYVLKMGFADVRSSPFFTVLQGFVDDVHGRTDGAVQIQTFGAGELGSQNNILTGLQVGIVDMAVHTAGFIETLFPHFAVLDLPYLFADRQVAQRVLDGPFGDQLLAEMPAKGIYGLSWVHWGWRPITTVERPVPQPSDLHGMRMRVQPGAIYAATYKQLGAIPVSIDVSEVYLALSQHAVDAIETPIISVVAGKDYEVAKYVNLSNIVYNAGTVLASKRRFDQMPEQYRTALRQAALTLSHVWRDRTVSLTEEMTGVVKQHGMQVLPVDLPAYHEATRPIYDQFRPVLGAELIDQAVRLSANG